MDVYVLLTYRQGILDFSGFALTLKAAQKQQENQPRAFIRTYTLDESKLQGNRFYVGSRYEKRADLWEFISLYSSYEEAKREAGAGGEKSLVTEHSAV